MKSSQLAKRDKIKKIKTSAEYPDRADIGDQSCRRKEGSLALQTKTFQRLSFFQSEMGKAVHYKIKTRNKLSRGLAATEMGKYSFLERTMIKKKEKIDELEAQVA